MPDVHILRYYSSSQKVVNEHIPDSPDNVAVADPGTAIIWHSSPARNEEHSAGHATATPAAAPIICDASTLHSGSGVEFSDESEYITNYEDYDYGDAAAHSCNATTLDSDSGDAAVDSSDSSDASEMSYQPPIEWDTLTDFQDYLTSKGSHGKDGVLKSADTVVQLVSYVRNALTTVARLITIDRLGTPTLKLENFRLGHPPPSPNILTETHTHFDTH